MYDTMRLGTAIADIERYITEIRGYNIKTVSDLNDSKTRNATAMLLFAILNRLSDIGNEIKSTMRHHGLKAVVWQKALVLWMIGEQLHPKGWSFLGFPDIMSAENLGAPMRYADAMPALAKANIINEQQANDLNKLMENRNVLAHFYGDVKTSTIFSLFKEIRVIEQFLTTIKKRIIQKEKS